MRLDLLKQKLKIKLGLAILGIDRRLNKFAEHVGNMGWLSMYGTLSIKHNKVDGSVVDYGIVTCKKITDEYVTYLALMHTTDSTAIGDFKYHISGTGTTAENNDHVELVTPIGTARTAGDQTSSTNTYISVAIIAYTDTLAVTEHGLFNTVYTSAQTDGTLMDRHLFSAINVISGDSVTYTYTLTISPEA